MNVIYFIEMDYLLYLYNVVPRLGLPEGGRKVGYNFLKL